MNAELIDAELVETREELRRADAKARDLLVVTGLVVTVGVAVTGLIDVTPPFAVVVCLGMAILLWLTAAVELLLVVRPLIVSRTEGAFADPHQDQSVLDLSIRQWRQRRWHVLADIVSTKFVRLRRAVDLLLGMLALVVVGGLLWAALSLWA